MTIPSDTQNFLYSVSSLGCGLFVVVCFVFVLLSFPITLWAHSYFKYNAATAKSLQSCPTLCDPRDGSPPGSPVPGILQARTLEWVAISFSNAWKWKVKVRSLSRVRLLATPWTAAYWAPPSTGFSRQEYWSGVPSSTIICSKFIFYMFALTLTFSQLFRSPHLHWAGHWTPLLVCVLTTFHPCSEILFWTVPTLVCGSPPYFLGVPYPAEDHSVPHVLFIPLGSHIPPWGRSLCEQPLHHAGPCSLAQDHSHSSLCPADPPCCSQTPNLLWPMGFSSPLPLDCGYLHAWLLPKGFRVSWKIKEFFLKIKVKLNKCTLMINARFIYALLEIKIVYWPSVRTQNTDDSPLPITHCQI